MLNGAKQWITNGGEAEIYSVIAMTDKSKGSRGASAFIVEKGTPGFTAPEIHKKISLRALVTSELGFHDCRIPADAMLPETTGLKNALMCLTQARYGIAWGVIGLAMCVFDEALQSTASNGSTPMAQEIRTIFKRLLSR